MEYNETDAKKREVEIYRCSRPVDLRGSGSSNQIGGATNSMPAGLQHWVLKFDFGDKILYVEGTEKDTKLMPQILSTPIYNLKVHEILGKKYLSPVCVSLLVSKHKLSFTSYDAVYNNCQHWFTEMVQLLDFSEKKVVPATSDIWFNGILMGGAIIVGGLFIAMAGSGQRRSRRE